MSVNKSFMVRLDTELVDGNDCEYWIKNVIKGVAMHPESVKVEEIVWMGDCE